MRKDLASLGKLLRVEKVKSFCECGVGLERGIVAVNGVAGETGSGGEQEEQSQEQRNEICDAMHMSFRGQNKPGKNLGLPDIVAR